MESNWFFNEFSKKIPPTDGTPWSTDDPVFMYDWLYVTPNTLGIFLAKMGYFGCKALKRCSSVCIEGGKNFAHLHFLSSAAKDYYSFKSPEEWPFEIPVTFY